MKKITFKKTMLFALSCMMLLTNNLFSQTPNYFGTSGTFSGNVWSTNPAGPYTSALVTTGGAVINFGNTATSSVTGANITVAGINVTQNVTINTIGGAISNYNNGVITINVSDNMTFDASTEVFTAQAGAGYIKSGGGVFANAGNTYGGGFTLSAGTLIARGVNAMGAGALTINGGTIAANAARDFTGKYSGITIGGDFTFGATTGLATTGANLTFNAATSLGSATRAITIGGTGIYTLGGVISGNAGIGLTVNSTAAGYLKLSGANTYTGTTTINTGTLRLGSSSALGTVDGVTVINSTSSSSGGILDLGGINYTTAEPLTVNGNGSGGGAIVNNIATEATFAGPITLGSATVIAGGQAKINLTNTIGGTGNLTIGGGTGGVVSGVMSMTGSLIIAGDWTISGANNYTGSTSITTAGKTLTLGASEVIPNGSAVILNNATLKTGATTGFSETAGTLQLLTNSATIALGTGVHTLTFADSHLVTWTAAKTLTITGWTGDATTGATAGRIFVGTSSVGLTATQLGQINFTGFGTGAQILSTGEIVPASIAAPTLTAAVGATVDGAFDVTFTDNATWRGAITSITIGGTTLDPSAYNTTVAGKITFTPSASALLQTAGAKNIVVVATNYFNATLSQTIGAGVPTSNSTATIDAALAKNASSTITCTAKDQYNNLVSGYTFKYDLKVTNSDATTAESYTIDGTAHTTTASDVTLTATTNSSGVATFAAALPATVDGGDGLSIQVQLANGSTNIGSAFAFSSQTYNLTGTKYSNDLALNGTSDITVSSGEFVFNSNPTVHSITVAPGAKLTLGTSTFNATNGITLQSDASGTATMTDNYSIPTVNATVKQWVAAGRNWYISSPIKDALYTTLNRGTGGTSGVVEWNEFTKHWDNVTMENASSGKLLTGKGYIQVATSTPLVTGSTGTIDFSGLANSGDVTVQLTRTESGLNRGFNLVGNPYPSYLDWKQVAAANTNVMPTIWLRTKKTTEAGGGYTFATVNIAAYLLKPLEYQPVISSGFANTTITTYIPPMQAYWVRLNTSPTTTDFKVTNDMRSHGDDAGNTFKAPTQKTSAQPLLRLQVSNGTASDEAVVYFNASASNGYDIFDSPKMANNGSASVPEIYTLAGSEQLVINGLNSVQYDTEMPIGFTTGQSNTFSIKASQFNNFEIGTKIFMKDYLDQNNPVISDLTNGDSYSFTSDITLNNTSRFTLTFKAPSVATGINNTESYENVWISTRNGQIVVNGTANSATIEIFNSIGQKIFSKNITGANVQMNNNLPAGAYLVKLTNEGKSIIRKIIID